jgi:transposase-like protein
MTKTQVEVITSVQRRRRWSRAEKERIVAAALEPAFGGCARSRDAHEPAIPVAATALQADADARRVPPQSVKPQTIDLDSAR